MKLKNRYILLILFITFLTGNVHGQWITEQVPSTSNLNSIHLLNENSGWIVGDRGALLYRYEDGWFKYPKITDANLNSVFLIDSNDGWAVGSNGTILHYNGWEWGYYISPTRENLYSVTFSDPDHGIAVGERGTIILYENGMWNLTEKKTRGNLYAVAAREDLSMVGGGLENISLPIMKIQNTEFDLVNFFDPAFIQIKSLAIPDPNEAWAVGRPGAIFHFDGNSWKKLSKFERLPTLNSVYFSDTSNGIAVGYNGTILTYSANGWNKETALVNVRLNGTTITGNTFYAVGNAGTVVSYKRKTEPVIQPVYNDDSKIVIESYPNPSAEVLNIILPDEGGFDNATLSLTDASGKIILTRKLGPSAAGQVYQVDTGEFSTGFYLISIKTAGNQSASGKFIVKH